MAQEAVRLVALGLSSRDIATRLGVNKSSVTRWMKAGKLANRASDRAPVKVTHRRQTPAQWAAAVRRAYDLDATDEQLVALAVIALCLSKDRSIGPQARMTATGRFQAVVKQLRLVARTETSTVVPEAAKRKTFDLPRRSGTDPRMLLVAVK